MTVIWHTKRFRSLRQRRALDLGRRVTIEEVSKDTGIPWHTLQRWETGNVSDPDPATVKQLAEYFGKTLDDFFSIEEVGEKKPGNHKASPVTENASMTALPV